jgi:hypothetical protein
MQVKVSESDSLFSYIEGSFMQIEDSGVEVRGLGYIGVNMSHNVTITCTPALQAVRNTPYSVDLRVGRSVDVVEKDRWPRTYTAHIWIAETPSAPDPPDGLMGIITSDGTVQLRWQDRSEEELGYIVERADAWQPQFRKIGVLPPNASGFADGNALQDMQYTYRVRAVGTTMSGYTKKLLMQTPVITALEADARREAVQVFPTVFEDYIMVTGDFSGQHPVRLILHDAFGRVVSSATYHSENFLRFYASVPAGLYFLRIASNDLSKSWKLWKK